MLSFSREDEHQENSLLLLAERFRSLLFHRTGTFEHSGQDAEKISDRKRAKGYEQIQNRNRSEEHTQIQDRKKSRYLLFAGISLCVPAGILLTSLFFSGSGQWDEGSQAGIALSLAGSGGIFLGAMILFVLYYRSCRKKPQVKDRKEDRLPNQSQTEPVLTEAEKDLPLRDDTPSNFSPGHVSGDQNESETVLIEEETRLLDDVLPERARLVPRVNDGSPLLLLKRETYTIGKSQRQSDLQISDPTVSRRHASLTWTEGEAGRGYTIRDLKSKNGTYVNDRRLQEEETCILRNKDVLRVGQAAFLYCDSQ